jgi:flagellar hook protein FlgE
MTGMTLFQAPAGGDKNDLSSWQPTAFNADGEPVCNAVFKNSEGTALPSQSIALNMGLKLNGSWNTGYATAAAVAADPDLLYTGTPIERASVSSTAYNGTSSTLSFEQNGYAAGQLTSIAVNQDGIMSGLYSNGQKVELFRIPLFRFISEDGLQLAGNNHYAATPASGPAQVGFPNTENFGSLAERYLEQSTVDMATEFSTMILTQRAFQMNSKVITTSDQMLQKAVELKR